MANIKMAMAIFALIGLAGGTASAQDAAYPPASQSAKPPAKKPKVWTDDNIASVRTPADIYQDQERQQSAVQQAAKKKTAEEAKLPSPPPGFMKPTTLQQADALLAQSQSNLKSEQEYVQQTQKELATAPDSYKDRLHWRIQARTKIINKLQSDIAALQKDRDALAKNSGDGTSKRNSEDSHQQ